MLFALGKAERILIGIEAQCAGSEISQKAPWYSLAVALSSVAFMFAGFIPAIQSAVMGTPLWGYSLPCILIGFVLSGLWMTINVVFYSLWSRKVNRRERIIWQAEQAIASDSFVIPDYLKGIWNGRVIPDPDRYW